MTKLVEKLCQNDYIFFLFCFATIILIFLGRVTHHRKGVLRTFQWYITSPQIPKISIGKTKENLQSFSDCKVGWSREMQWKNDNVLYKCIEGKSGTCLLLAMFIGEDWMVNLMIICIKKIIAKALDFNDIIKNIMGMSAH
jgi:hypothetical protein